MEDLIARGVFLHRGCITKAALQHNPILKVLVHGRFGGLNARGVCGFLRSVRFLHKVITRLPVVQAWGWLSARRLSRITPP